jgi:hypothetical protein
MTRLTGAPIFKRPKNLTKKPSSDSPGGPMPALEIFIIAMRLQSQLDQAMAAGKPVSGDVVITHCGSNHGVDSQTLPPLGSPQDLAVGGIVKKYGIRKAIEFTYCILDRIE